MAGAGDPLVPAALTVPGDDVAVAAACVEDLPVGAEAEGSDGFVVALHHLLHLGRVVQVQVVEEAR